MADIGKMLNIGTDNRSTPKIKSWINIALYSEMKAGSVISHS